MWEDVLRRMGWPASKPQRPPAASRVEGYLPIPILESHAHPDQVTLPFSSPTEPSTPAARPHPLCIQLVHQDAQGQTVPLLQAELTRLMLRPDQAFRMAVANLEDLTAQGKLAFQYFGPMAPRSSYLLVHGPMASSALLLPALPQIAQHQLGISDLRVWIPRPDVLLVIPYHFSTRPELLTPRWTPILPKTGLGMAEDGACPCPCPYWFKLGHAGVEHDETSQASGTTGQSTD